VGDAVSKRQVNTATGTAIVTGTVASTVLTDGAWHQVGFVSGSGSFSLALDGSIIASQSDVQIQAVSSPRVWIGRDTAGHYFSGSIDEVEVRKDALTSSNLLTRYNVDSNKDGLPDRWAWKYFGTLSVNSKADADGDGVTNGQEYLNGTSPTDYYNGQTPIISVVSGNGQNATPKSYLAQGLTVLVTNAGGAPLANAPVTFSAVVGGGSLATTNGSGTVSANVTVRAGADGKATAYYKQGSAWGVR